MISLPTSGSARGCIRQHSIHPLIMSTDGGEKCQIKASTASQLLLVIFTAKIASKWRAQLQLKVLKFEKSGDVLYLIQ